MECLSSWQLATVLTKEQLQNRRRQRPRRLSPLPRHHRQKPPPTAAPPTALPATPAATPASPEASESTPTPEGPTWEYLTEAIPACTPIEGVSLDPCRPQPVPEYFGPTGTVSGGEVTTRIPPKDLAYFLDDGRSTISKTHIVARGTFKPGSVRCTTGNFAYTSPHLEDWILGAAYLKCFADLNVREYILGSGPPVLTLEVHHYEYASDEFIEGYRSILEDVAAGIIILPAGSTLPGLEDTTPTEEEADEFFRSGSEAIVEDRDGFYTKELMHFISPGYDVRMETWKTWYPWGIERMEDGSIVVVHPERRSIRDLWAEGYTRHRAELEMPLATFKAAVLAADQARRTANNGRIAPATHERLKPGRTFPMLQSDANKIADYFREAGGYGHPQGDPEPPPPACGLGAVADQFTDNWLMRDCLALLPVKDTLRGTASLNWDTSVAIGSWDGVTVGGTPRRVTKLKLANKSLTGNLPEAMGGLTGLTELKLAGNTLTGCIPHSLKSVATNDLSSLSLQYCQPIGPTGLTAAPDGDVRATLTWNAVPDATSYRLEYKERGDATWALLANPSATTYAVDRLTCGTKYAFRVSAVGSESVFSTPIGYPSDVSYEAPKLGPGLFSPPNCYTPVFAEEIYAFTLAEDAAAATPVGVVSATDPNQDALTYSIVAGNSGSVFTIGAQTGAIAVSEALYHETVAEYSLTVEATDGANTTTVQVTITVTDENDAP